MTSKKQEDINELMIKEASDTLLFISDSYNENKYAMKDMEFLCHVKDAAQDIVYNLTQIIRNLTAEIDDE